MRITLDSSALENVSGVVLRFIQKESVARESLSSPLYSPGFCAGSNYSDSNKIRVGTYNI